MCDIANSFSLGDLATMQRVLDEVCPRGSPTVDREAKASALLRLFVRGVTDEYDLGQQLMQNGSRPEVL